MKINLDTIKFALADYAAALYRKTTGRYLFAKMYHECSNCEVNVTMVSYYTTLNKSFGSCITRWTFDKSLHNAKIQYSSKIKEFSYLFVRGSATQDCPRCYGLKAQGIKGVSVQVHKSNSGQNL